MTNYRLPPLPHISLPPHENEDEDIDRTPGFDTLPRPDRLEWKSPVEQLAEARAAGLVT